MFKCPLAAALGGEDAVNPDLRMLQESKLLASLDRSQIISCLLGTALGFVLIISPLDHTMSEIFRFFRKDLGLLGDAFPFTKKSAKDLIFLEETSQ